MKKCSRCIIDKPLSEFNKNKTTRDGHRYECRECQRKQMAKYRQRNPRRDKHYYENNKEDINKRRRIAYQENKDEILERNRDYRKRNKEVVARAKARWSEVNADKMREYRRNYKERNRLQIKISEQNREAMKRMLVNDLNEDEFIDTLYIFESACGICLSSYEHLDHFIPLSSGHGGTTKTNAIPMCSKCNVSKHASNPFEWAETLSEEQRINFDKVVEYLAELNGLTVDDYREFVFWCFKNKRSVDEINDENRDSLNVWLRLKDAS